MLNSSTEGHKSVIQNPKLFYFKSMLSSNPAVNVLCAGGFDFATLNTGMLGSRILNGSTAVVLADLDSHPKV